MFKKRMIRMVLIVVAVLGVAVLALAVVTGVSEAQGPDDQPGRGGLSAGNGSPNVNAGAGLPPAVEGGLTTAASAALVAGIQDEYHAYATYQAVIDQFGPVQPFVRIQAAEAQHIAALENLFDRYGLPVPEPSAFEAVPTFGSLAEACAAGATAEVANFDLYDQWLDQVQAYPDLVKVFTALRDASQFNHLPAFERCAG
jgi:hypothetical protein